MEMAGCWESTEGGMIYFLMFLHSSLTFSLGHIWGGKSCWARQSFGLFTAYEYHPTVLKKK